MRNQLLLRFSLFLAATPALLHAETPATAKTFLFDPVDAARERTVPVKVYLKPSDSPQPVVIFSHGLGGSRENSGYLGNHWADHGYVAVFVQHAGSDEEVWKKVERSERMAVLKKAASIETALARYADIPFVIDELEKWNAADGHPLKGKLKLEKIGSAVIASAR
jgi:predicted dienelactone hydrolase